ncbi:MAG TPA: adenylate/guanylate cyclase domain-containing protein [Syntrophorhabdaceae bacterium]|jgi:adenylate cyclase
MKKILIPILFGVASTLLFSFFSVTKFLPFERLELLLHDMRYQIHGKSNAPGEITIVGIDDRDIERLGRWPWERERIATLIERLSEMGAKVIVSDIILSEPSRGDERLEETVRGSGRVILPMVFSFGSEQRKSDDEALLGSAFSLVKNPERLRLFPPVSAASVLLPLERLSAGASALGHINMFPDKDGVLRWEAMALEYDGEIYPSIDIQAARLFLGLPAGQMVLLATHGVKLGDLLIPTDQWGRSLIHYYGPEKTFPYLSASDIFDGTQNTVKVKDKIVILGVTAVGIYDLRVTPASPAMPGVEKHAHVIASILHNHFVVKADNVVNLAIVLISGMFFLALSLRVKALWGALLCLGAVAALFVATYSLFFQRGLWIGLSYPANNILVIYLAVTAYRYTTEERYAKRIRNMFSSYVTEKIVNELIKNPSLARLGGERREVTVLFSDVKDFTSFSEKYPAEEVVAMLNEYLGEMTHIILAWDGTVDKFVGDMIVAFWGAPVPQENHAALAVQCALHMRKRLRELQKKWGIEGKPVLDAGIGINTGEVVVGNIGAEGKKMEYTVIGDNVNLGSRVEGLTRKYDAPIMITEPTLDAIRTLIDKGSLKSLEVRGLEEVIVKGRTTPVCIYELKAREEGERSLVIECETKEIVSYTEK